MDTITVPLIDVFKTRFGFIADETLKTNLAIEMQYISFMVSLSDNRLPGFVKYTIYKDIIVHTACIIESLLSYKLQKMLHEGTIQPAAVTFKSATVSAFKEIYISPAKDFVIAQYKQGYKEEFLKVTTNFKNINDLAKKVGVINKSLFEKCENIRKKRNKIHLIGLNDIEDKYQKPDIEDTFNLASQIIVLVK